MTPVYTIDFTASANWAVTAHIPSDVKPRVKLHSLYGKRRLSDCETPGAAKKTEIDQGKR